MRGAECPALAHSGVLVAARVITVAAPAKVNLHLGVGALRPDGYHDLVTVFQALEFGDEVTLAGERPFGVRCLPDCGVAMADNLATRAAMAFAERYGVSLLCEITISKRVPAGGGLGGASADAAAVLLGLSVLHDLPGDAGPLVELAHPLGADVAFLLAGGTALYGGRGDVCTRRLPPLEAHIVLVNPGEPVSTAEAYTCFDRLPSPEPSSPQRMLEALEAHDDAGVAALLRNDLAAPAILLVPAIAEVLEAVRNSPGVLGAEVSGSGSTVFGIAQDAVAAEAVVATAVERGWWAVATRAQSGGVRVISDQDSRGGARLE